MRRSKIDFNFIKAFYLTDFDRLEGSIRLAFQEKGLKKPFPAHLISDGTINLLAILVTLFDRPLPFGMTLIEEPESGLHPHASKSVR
jgi:predicted ATPase